MRVPVFLVCLGGLGCSATGPADMPTEGERRTMVALMLPDRIKIQPFTKIASFDDDDTPDGILAVLRPVDKLGDPAKAAGLFYFDLWSYQKASGDRRGEQLAHWDVTIASENDVRQHWTRGQMYDFQLAWPEDVDDIPPARKYIFTATYRTPWDQTLQDEYELEFSIPAELAGKASADQ